MRRLQKNRGQSLVMFAMSLLLLLLMVTMTLSFGTKAKEKIELQQVADQAAYSTAVATARGMNVIAMTNRVMLAHMVALAGIQSSISFAGLWLGVADAMAIFYALEIATIQAPACASWWMSWCGCPGVFNVGIREILAIYEGLRTFFVLMAFDPQCANKANINSLVVMLLYVGQVETQWNGILDDAVQDQRMARKVVNQVGGAEWRTPSGASSVAVREVGRMPYLDGAINSSMLIATDRHAVFAAMGSRGHPWTAGRGNMMSMAPMILRMQALAVFGADISLLLNDGNGYFGAPFHTNNMLTATSTAAVADDHAAWQGDFITGFGCQPGLRMPLAAASFVWTNAVPGIGLHMAGVGYGIPVPGPTVIVAFPTFFDTFHPISGACILNCPSAWTNFVDYNLARVHRADDNFAQPKLPVLVQRDLRAKTADPWNMMFNFRHSQATPGRTFDTREGTRDGVSGNGIILYDGTDISLQTAMSTGQAYYHIANDWRGPPNLFNPFWRAGLTRSDIDEQSTDDIRNLLNGNGASWAGEAYDRLRAVGFRGLQ